MRPPCRHYRKGSGLCPYLLSSEPTAKGLSPSRAVDSGLKLFVSDLRGRQRQVGSLAGAAHGMIIIWNWIIGTGWNWNSGNNRVRCSPDWSVYRCIERYCMTPRQGDDDNNLSGGNRNHLKLGIEPESWLQSHELGF